MEHILKQLHHCKNFDVSTSCTMKFQYDPAGVAARSPKFQKKNGSALFGV